MSAASAQAESQPVVKPGVLPSGQGSQLAMPEATTTTTPPKQPTNSSSKAPPLDAEGDIVPQETDHRQPEPVGDPNMALEQFDWDDLEERYRSRMESCSKAEQEIYKEFGDWIRLFEAWASTTTVYENERSHKRLKTRMNYVQGAEDRLEKRRQHYRKVVGAFEQALALLGSG